MTPYLPPHSHGALYGAAALGVSIAFPQVHHVVSWVSYSVHFLDAFTRIGGAFLVLNGLYQAFKARHPRTPKPPKILVP